MWDEGVDFRDFFQDLVPVATDQASGDHEARRATFSLKLSQLHDAVQGFFHRLGEERAGIYEEAVSILRFVNDDTAGFVEVAEHYFGVDQIFITSKGNDGNFHGRTSRLGEGTTERPSEQAPERLGDLETE